MGVQKLIIDIIDDDYELIAIHCSLASYRLAFLLNKYLDLRLHRKKNDIHFEYNEFTANFELLQYEDHFQYRTYSLMRNIFRTKKISQSPTTKSMSLFDTTGEEVLITKYLIPELKNVDYFLKLDTETTTHIGHAIVSKLLDISQVITAYIVDYTQLKSKNNLILE